MTISPLSAVTALATPIRRSAAEPAPSSIAPAQGGNASQTPTGASQIESSSALTAIVAISPAEAVLPDPGPFVMTPTGQSTDQDPNVAPQAQNRADQRTGTDNLNKPKPDNTRSSVVLKPNEIPPSEDMQALIKARQRAEIFQNSFAIKQLIASLEMAVATELPISKASNVGQPPVQTKETTGIADPNATGSTRPMADEKPDQSVDLRY